MTLIMLIDAATLTVPPQNVEYVNQMINGKVRSFQNSEINIDGEWRRIFPQNRWSWQRNKSFIP